MAKRRGNQEGAIYKRPNGRWQAQVTIEGKRFSKSFTNQKECREWIREITGQKKRGLTPDGARITFAQFLEQWLKDAKPSLALTTWLQYENIVHRDIIPSLGKIKLADLKPPTIQNLYSSKLLEGKGKRTVALIHAVIHRSLSIARKQGLVGYNAASSVQKPRHSPKEMMVLDDNQVRELLIASEGKEIQALLQLAVTTGLRKGELLGLKWADIDWARSALRIQRQLLRIPKEGLILTKPKSNSSVRTVKVGSSTLTRLAQHRESQDAQKKKMGARWNDQGLVFPSSIGTPKEPRNLIREFKNLLKIAGLPNIRFHDLRHTAASLMLMSDMRLIRISRQLGHAKPSTTLDVYGHLIPALETEAIEMIDELVTPIAADLQQVNKQR